MLSIPCIPPIARSIWIHSFSHTLVHLAHLLRIEVLDLLLILEKLLHAPHLLHHPTELLKLVEQGMHLHLHDTSSTGNSGDSCWLFGEGLESIHVVKFLVVHAVHDGHQTLKSFHTLLVTHLSVAPLTSPKYRT